MKRLLGLAVVALLSLPGCVQRWYPLPIPAAEAHLTFAPIHSVALELGYKTWLRQDGVQVNPDAMTRIDFAYDINHNYSMSVFISDKKAARAMQGGEEGALARGKQIGDDIFRRAIALRRATAPFPAAAPVYADPPPPVQIQVQ